ncbi:hypothetical protein BSCG_05729 [Bacteroides sp. 2_2_4]|nr:hypothetical protein BSCG_05729 [Bacteroides sp. 2_2_4]CAG9882912.1 hypothetical protein BOVA115_5616 [Bacteroides ovatus]
MYVAFLINQPCVSLKPTVRFIRINRMFFANNTVIYMQMTVLLFVIMHINTIFYLFTSLLNVLPQKLKILKTNKS